MAERPDERLALASRNPSGPLAADHEGGNVDATGESHGVEGEEVTGVLALPTGKPPTEAGRASGSGRSSPAAGSAWVDIHYTPDGVAQVAECAYNTPPLIVRRTRF